MFVCITENRSGETLLLRRLGPHEIMDARRFADRVAEDYCTEIDDSDGIIPDGSGDINVEFRQTKKPSGSCWTSTDFFFARWEA
jgi:hypothetical protein